MTQAEKLQKLIELAQANGFDKRFGAIQITETALDTSTGNLYTTQFPVSIETYVFDHEFIKALCDSVKNEDVKRCVVELSTGYSLKRNPAASLMEPDTLVCAEKFEYVLYRLAFSTNRIDYLYGEFCE